MNKIKVAIVGTVGLPANYGGWETLINNIIQKLTSTYDVDVYCSSKRYTVFLKKFKNANLIYINIDANGMQSILYDFFSMWRSRRNAQVQLILGVSGCIFLPFLKIFSSSKFIVNIDGIEWKRAKWGYLAKIFLKLSEMTAVKYSDLIICDNQGIADYISTSYKKNSICVAYGGDQAKHRKLNQNNKLKYKLPQEYAFKVARIEPENNLKLILKSFKKTGFPLVIVGNWQASVFGRNLKHAYKNIKNIVMLEAIYNQNVLDEIRSNSILYIHGHSAGGTNPSLVEAMWLGLPIFAFDVTFNRYTTENKAAFFKNSLELENLLNGFKSNSFLNNGEKMKLIANHRYRWKTIAQEYSNLIKSVF
jgi:glycosyltransferase involved in cell wall biosynthesis